MGPADQRERDGLAKLNHCVEWHEVRVGCGRLSSRHGQAEHECALPQLLLGRQGHGRVGCASEQAERLLPEGIAEGEGGASGERVDPGVDQPGRRGRARAAE